MSRTGEALQAGAGDAEQVSGAMVRDVRTVGIAMLQEATREMVIAAVAGETVMVTDDSGRPIVQLTKLPKDVDPGTAPRMYGHEELVAAGVFRLATGDQEDLPMPEPAPPRPPERDYRNKTGELWEVVAKLREIEEFMRSRGCVNNALELDRMADWLIDDALAEDAKKRDESTAESTAEATVYADSST